jgi:hypothetical protein
MSVISRPQDMPELRLRMRGYMAKHGPKVLRKKLETGDLFYQGFLENKTVTADWVCETVPQIHIRTLEAAELFYVRSDMVELALAAAASLPDFQLEKHDLPSPSGLLFFETPIDSRTHQREYMFLGTGRWNGDSSQEVTSHLCALTWSDLGEALHVVWWEDVNTDLARLAGSLGLDEEDMAKQRQRVPMEWFADTRVGFGSNWREDPTVDSNLSFEEAREKYLGIRMMSVLQSTWLLMKQDLSSVENAHFDRAAHRRAKREGRDVPRVRVIALRRTGSGAGGDGTREWHHRWIVRGHWRNQWYPSHEVHRPIWVNPHVKGPEDAPLLVGEKVYDLRR